MRDGAIVRFDLTSSGQQHRRQAAASFITSRCALVLLVVVTSACTLTSSDQPPSRDLYAEALAGIRGPTLFPAERPPQLDYVLLQSVEGQELLALQHRDIQVLVCPDSPCGERVRLLRDIEVGTEASGFTIEYAGLGQIPTAEPELNAVLTEFWSNVEFVAERPEWLTMDLYPGGA